MINSIQQFQTEGVKKLEKIFCGYASDLTKVAEMVQRVTDRVMELGLSMIAEEWESYDTLLHDRKDLRPGWQVVRRDEVKKLTSLGEVRYKKTYFHNPQTGERCCLLDRLMGFAAGERLTEDALARIYEEAAEGSYQKGGMNASINCVPVSKETVMEKLHSLRFPETERPKKKRQVKTLYIDAGEDHVALQYLEKRGDTRGALKHTFLPKLVYVYEGIQAEGERHELVGVKYFGGGYGGRLGTERLWKEVYDYISGSYDEEVLERIYVNGDGAEWIKTGADKMARLRVYQKNGGDMLKLVRYQKQELPKAAGMEEVV